MPQNLRLYWGFKPVPHAESMMKLLAIKVATCDGIAPLDDLVITDARQDYDQYGDTKYICQ